MPSRPLVIREREEIRAGLAARESVSAIAERLGRCRCTISREISRNGGAANYRASAAQDRADQQRRRPKTPVFEQHPALAAHVTERLEAKDSPMTIAVELAQGKFPEVGVTVSHETIYQRIYNWHRRGGLPRHLFSCLHRPRRFRFRRRSRRPQQRWRDTARPIALRSAAAADRSEIGHLEGDLIIGAHKSKALITVFDRKSRHLWMTRLPHGRTAELTLDALTDLLERIPPHLRRTLAWDQGSEIACHAELEQRTGITVYIADAHSPWQRPTNENGNGLIRRYIGKPADITTLTDNDITAIEHRINTMPRRIHNWRSAHDIYHQAVAMTG